MKSLSEFNFPIQFLLTDIDDTLTDEGLLGPEAYEALWNLHRAKIHVIPVTGRPAGWCELIARQWPVAGVVGENGGFYFRYMDRNIRVETTGEMRRHYYYNAATRADHNRQLEKIRAEIIARVPGSAVAS